MLAPEPCPDDHPYPLDNGALCCKHYLTGAGVPLLDTDPPGTCYNGENITCPSRVTTEYCVAGLEADSRPDIDAC